MELIYQTKNIMIQENGSVKVKLTFKARLKQAFKDLKQRKHLI